MANKFKGGEVVTLNSGSPKMTVSWILSDGQTCVCHWFAGSEMRHGEFHEDALTLAPIK